MENLPLGLDAVLPHSSDQELSAETARASHRVPWLALVVTVGLVTLVYLSLSLAASSHPLLMPLDDTYIHFQYARQFALGHPMVYNPGDPPTSGGTSLLYPPLLALGYLLGFTGWSLAYWALIIGVFCFFGSSWLIYLIARSNPLTGKTTPAYALSMALAFALCGPAIWAALSGMETSLFVFLVLLTLYAVQSDRSRLAVAAALGMTLTRPEGLILAGCAMLGLFLRRKLPADWPGRIRWIAGLSLPVLAGAIQPVINWIATGSPSSSGLQAKSHLTNAGAPMADRVSNVLDFFGRMWRELLSGRSADFGTFTSPILAEAALAGLLVAVWLSWRQRRLNIGVIVLAWILALTAAVSTLDTAFWQFKRYQLPVMALFFPAAAWSLATLAALFERRAGLRWVRWVLPLLILLPSLFTTVTFARNYLENVSVVRDQQVPMARWAAKNLPAEARVGVHDVGLVRYFGQRSLYDVVGLTTPGPAVAWRQGPGVIYEVMAHSKYRPDYFAIYPDVQGLRYLLNAGVFGSVLAEFPVNLPPQNVASAAPLQVVYEADWSNTHPTEHIAQPTTIAYTDGLTLVDQIDVASPDSEADHDYRWWFDGVPQGFVSEVYRNYYRACALEDAACQVTDGGRVITGGEEFTLHTRQGEDLLLVTRVLGRTSIPLTIYVNDRRLAQRVQPAVSNRWIEVVTWVPGDQITGSSTRIRIEAHVADPRTEAYLPYYHWAYQGTVYL